MAVIVRQVALVDAEKLSKLCIDTFYNRWKSTNSEEDLQVYIHEHFTSEKIKQELSNKDIIYLVAELNNCFIGYTKLNKNKADGDLGGLGAIEMQRMYVIENFIGQNVGKKLMIAALERAKTEFFEVIWLGVWDKNIRAMKFYQSFGFSQYGEHEFILVSDITIDILMKKIL